jgi:undecaprenyl-diphosphatase
MRLLSVIGGPLARTILVSLSALALARAGKWAEAVFLVATVGGTGAVNSTIKRITGRRRPSRVPGGPRTENDSFPSGHTSGTIVLTGATTFLIWCLTGDRRLTLASLLGSTVLSGVMGYSRVYLRRHHVSDVIAGVGLGLTTLALGIAGFRRLMSADSK